MFRKSVKNIKNLKRSIHTLPELEFSKAQGIPGLYSTKGLDISWYQYQQYVLDNLNELLKQRENYTGSGFETPVEVLEASLLDAKHDSVAAKISHWASLAYTNEFFFQSLDPSGASESQRLAVDPSNTNSSESLLLDSIRSDLDGVEPFKELMLSRGSSMFGNGSLWLINLNGNLKVLNCYNSGTPYSAPHGKSASGAPIDIATEVFKPLFCVNLWQHSYLHDYGVDGKRKFLESVWNAIDWQRVALRT